MNPHPLILLVDDEPNILEMYGFSLQQAGFEVLTATNGEDAIKIATEKLPQLVLMDVKMPILDGLGALLKLKENPATSNLRIVFLTAFSDPNRPEVDTKAAKELGAYDYLKKGISLEEFVAKVKGYLA